MSLSKPRSPTFLYLQGLYGNRASIRELIAVKNPQSPTLEIQSGLQKSSIALKRPWVGSLGLERERNCHPRFGADGHNDEE